MPLLRKKVNRGRPWTAEFTPRREGAKNADKLKKPGFLGAFAPLREPLLQGRNGQPRFLR